MPKSMYELDEQELGALIEELSQTVERLAHEVSNRLGNS
jgi:hypothetical protein